MTVAFDAVTTSGAFADAAPSFSHTPVGTPKGAIVFIPYVNTMSVTGVTYGGVAMTQVSLSPFSPGIGEVSTVDWAVYYLGASIPTGAQTVTATRSGTGVCRMVVATFTAAADTEVVDTSTLANASLADPSVSLTLGGVECTAILTGASGQAAPTSITPLTNWTSRDEEDSGSVVWPTYSYDTVSTADITAGWTQTADDAYIFAVAIRESAGGGGGFQSAWARNANGIMVPNR